MLNRKSEINRNWILRHLNTKAGRMETERMENGKILYNSCEKD
jgi:hypothetical protein